MKTLIFALALFNFGMGFTAHAASDQKKNPNAPVEWSTVQRENMAKMHENMATCLRSTKSMTDCRAEARTSCQQMKDGCPWAGKGRGHGGMMGEE